MNHQSYSRTLTYRLELQSRIDDDFRRLDEVDPADRGWLIMDIRFNQELHYKNVGERYRERELREKLDGVA